MNVCQRLILGAMVAVLVLPLAGAMDEASAQNLLLNHDFETGDFTDWVVFGESASSIASVQSPDNGPSFGGANHVFLDNRGQALALGMKQSTPIGAANPGTVYYLFDLKLGEAANGGVFFVEVFAEQSGVGVIGSSGVLGPYTPADWTTYQGSFVAPAGTDFLTMQFAAITGAVVGSISTMHVDNAYLSQGGPAVPDESMSWGRAKILFRD